MPKRIAVVTTIYKYLSHAQHMADRFLVGYPHEGRWHKPDMQIVSLYVDQTDQDGIYSKPVNDSRTPRLRGYMRTGADGRYEYATIKPGSYPNTRNPAHIHYVVNASEFKERIFEIVFASDPLVDEGIRERAGQEDSAFSIRPLSRDAQGVWRCTQDIQLKK